MGWGCARSRKHSSVANDAARVVATLLPLQSSLLLDQCTALAVALVGTAVDVSVGVARERAALDVWACRVAAGYGSVRRTHREPWSFWSQRRPGTWHPHDLALGIGCWTGLDGSISRIRFCIGESLLGVITGEVGVGKTVALRAATTQLDPTPHHVIYVATPTFGARGLYLTIVHALALKTPGSESRADRPSADLTGSRRTRASSSRGVHHRRSSPSGTRPTRGAAVADQR